MTDLAQEYGLCTPCHETITEPPYYLIINDCLTSGCHSWEDVDTNGWHHNSDLSGSDNCAACHDPILVEEPAPIDDIVAYPPTILTPSPFNCENCHWEQKEVEGQGPEDPGHPSTYNHKTSTGINIGYLEYGTPIRAIKDTHHMGFKGNVSVGCYRCHALPPSDPGWDPYDKEAIRYCQRCHSMDSLHRIESHVVGVKGWEAIGFHVPIDQVESTDVDPDQYGLFYSGQMCYGCHGTEVTDLPGGDPCLGKQPYIDTSLEGILPSRGSLGANVTLFGNDFGDEYLAENRVQIRLRKNGEWVGAWKEMPIISWTDTLIEFEISSTDGALPSGNYRVRVQTGCGNSNNVSFILKDSVSLEAITPGVGSCTQRLFLKGENLGDTQSKIFRDGYHGVHRVIDFISPEPRLLTAVIYGNWSETSVEVEFSDFFEDTVAWGNGERNYVQDSGAGSCTIEPTISLCDDLPAGNYAVVFKNIFFGDDDGSGDLSCEDTIFQVVTSDPLSFELLTFPQIDLLSHDPVARGDELEVYGKNFGIDFTAYEVRIGTKKQALDTALGRGKVQETIRSWTDTQITFKVKVPARWEGKTRYLWLENSQKKTISYPLQISAPEE